MLSSCLANAAPDAGQALRDVESRRLNLPAPVELDAERPSPEDGVSRAAEEGGPTVLVKRFQLSGNRQFDDRRLLALLHDLPGQELNLSQLHAAAAASAISIRKRDMRWRAPSSRHRKSRMERYASKCSRDATAGSNCTTRPERWTAFYSAP